LKGLRYLIQLKKLGMFRTKNPPVSKRAKEARVITVTAVSKSGT